MRGWERRMAKTDDGGPIQNKVFRLFSVWAFESEVKERMRIDGESERQREKKKKRKEKYSK